MDHRHHAAGHDQPAANTDHLQPALREPSSYEVAILVGLQGKPHVYGGTVPPGVVADRRARNKRARAARRTARKA